MPEHIINCPQCQRQLRVPEEMLGRLVKCPTCSTAFTVGTGGSAVEPATMPVPAPRGEGDLPPGGAPGRKPRGPTPPAPSVPDDYADDARPQAGSAIMAPGICLLLVGILAVLANLFVLANFLIMGKQGLVAQAQAQPNPLMPNLPKGAEGQAALEMGWTAHVVMASGSALASLVVVLGAILMLCRRGYVMAFASAVLAMLLFYPCCCVLGIPFGIWSMVVLARPDVKAAFM